MSDITGMVIRNEPYVRPGCALRNPHVWLVLLLVCVSAYRFTLIGSGHFFWGDEVRYRHAERLVDAAIAGAFREAAAQPFQSYSRPGFVILGSIPALLQRTVGKVAGIERDTLAYYDTVSAFNVVISIGVALCMYRLGRIWTGDPWNALLITGVYALLCHANIWIRHLTPYHLSLLLFLSGLVLVSSPSVDKGGPGRRIVTAGILSALGYACYPIYYGLGAINAVVLLVVSRRRVSAGTTFLGGALAVVALFEVMARCGGTSYVGEMWRSISEHTGQKSHGAFGEGYVFIWRYLRDVEGPIGVVLFVLFALLPLTAIRRSRRRMSPATCAAMTTAVGCYLLHATMSVVFHKTIFFGRFLGAHLPFLVGGAVLTLTRLRHVPLDGADVNTQERRTTARARARRSFWARWQSFGIPAVASASVWSFATFARPYARLVYPADLFFGTMSEHGVDVTLPPSALWGFAGEEADSVEELDPRFAMVMDARPEGTENPLLPLRTHEEAAAGASPFIGVNLKWVYYYREQDAHFDPPENYVILAQADSPTAFAPIAYEAYKPWERKRLLQRRYRMRIYERTGTALERTADVKTPAD